MQLKKNWTLLVMNMPSGEDVWWGGDLALGGTIWQWKCMLDHSNGRQSSQLAFAAIHPQLSFSVSPQTMR